MPPLTIAGGLLLGIAVGAVSGLFGLGGGAILIPALMLFYGMSQKLAQGTSLATLLLPIGAFAFYEYYKAGEANLKLATLLAIGFVLGGYLGGRWAQQLPELYLRRGFAVLLIFIAVRMLLK